MPGHPRLNVLRSEEPSRNRPEYWRSLGESLGFEDAEFPPGADEKPEGQHRRSFLAHLGASMALAGLGTACRDRFVEKILPYSRQPPEVTPGVASWYATSMVVGGYAAGLLVESREGRPIKIEGNPDHPASLGSTSLYHQASLLELYEPHRRATVRQGKQPRSWASFARAFGGADRDVRTHVLLQPTSSPLIIELIGRVLETQPRARFHFWDPLAPMYEAAAARAVFGRSVARQLDLDAARVIVDLDANLFTTHPFAVRYGRQYADGRRVRGGRTAMNRLYAVEPSFTAMGSLADHRLRIAGSRVGGVAAAILAEVVALLRDAVRVPRGFVDLAGRIGPIADRLRTGLDAAESAFARAVARDLVDHRGAGVVVAGARQPAAVHAMVLVLDALLGNVRSTVLHTEPAIFELGEESHSLDRLAGEIRAGGVDRLLILGGNPVYNAPADLRFGDLVRSVPLSAHLGMYDDETGRCCTWALPEAHYLETWGDARAFDGTYSVIQPLIQPLFNGRSPAQVLAALSGETRGLGDLLRARFDPRPPLRVPSSLEEQQDFGRLQDPPGALGISGVAPPETPGSWLTDLTREDDFAHVLRRGLVEGTRLPAIEVELDVERAAGLIERSASGADDGSLELAFSSDNKVRGGEYTPNNWLLELPDPITKQSWGNAALISPALAERLHVETSDWIRLVTRAGTLDIRALVVPGQADRTVSVALGWGREVPGAAAGVGTNVYPLRTSRAEWFDGTLQVAKLPRPPEELAITERHWWMHGRRIADIATLSHYLRDPTLGHDHTPPPSLRSEEWLESAPQWAMAIDLGVCTGCSACVIACQAENNIPVVGEINVKKSREMHWLRIDRYYTGSAEDPAVVSQPMLCQHCETAPCEYVCPVGATAHSHDGLNDMVYNRCVGTRFCSNNCPYKVRRFNWLDFNGDKSHVEKMVMNPDVTVRERGVMEKCTYCVQRIRRAGIDARIAGRPIRDGELMTACEQACPTRAIVFGDLTDPESQVRALHDEPRTYSVLQETGTRPRTKYLTRLVNLNPRLVQGPRDPEDG